MRKADPYGTNIPSKIPRPNVSSGEPVPEPGLPPEYPFYLKPIPVNDRDTLQVLRGYLNKKEPKIQRWLYSTWNAEREALKYQEIRNAIRDHEVPLEWIMQWQQDYSRFIIEVLDPEWRKAMESSGGRIGELVEKYAGRPFGFTPTGRRIEEWIQVRGGELAVNLSDLQHEAVKLIIRRYTVDMPLSAQELARVLRPVIGLTPKQAAAVARYRENLLAEGLDPKKVAHQVGNYAGFLHRQRALRIARTELSFAYNYGQFEAIRQAQEQGYFGGEVVKVWMTADDERTCDFCGPLDGQVIGLEETFPGLTDKLPNIFVPPAHPNCFSEDTEVFTEEGWKHFYELTGRERIWTLNLETEELELDEAVEWIEYPYEGEMVHFLSRTIDCLVTPNHNMVIRTSWMHKKHKNSPLVLRRADEVKHSDVIPRTAKWRGKHVDTITIGRRVFPARAVMRFLGWYIAEGSISKPARGHWQVKIAQEKEENRKEIIELCRQLFGDVWIGADAIYVPRLDDIKDYFLVLGKAHEKHLPSEIKGLSAELLREFWEAFCLGDGYIRQSSWKDHPEWNFGKECVATTSSRQLMNDLTEIALKIGMRPSFRVEQPRTVKHWNGVYTSKHEQWRISFGSRRYSVFEPQYRQKVPYKGRVYCVQMRRNPALFVRRNGKTLWAGNCRCTIGYQVLERRE